MAKIEDTTQAAIVDAVAALLLTVSSQIRSVAPEAAQDLIAKREVLLNGEVQANDEEPKKDASTKTSNEAPKEQPAAAAQ